jgi:hypothetical protein
MHVLRYLMEMDGYTGSNMSVLSSHLFSWKTSRNAPPANRLVKRLAYQQEPDSLLWFVLEDGTAVTCTYIAEHEVVAWARQETTGTIGDVTCVPGDGYDEAWFAVRRNGSWGIERLAPREAEELFTDPGGAAYESALTTLRVNFDTQSGSLMPAKKLISRLTVCAVRSDGLWAAPASDAALTRRQYMKIDYTPYMTESDIMLNAGFERGAGVRIWTDGASPLTILALCPLVTAGAG